MVNQSLHFGVDGIHMSIPAAVLVQMATLGLNREQAEAVASMLSAVEEATRSEGDAGKEKARARWRRWRESHPRTNDEQRLPTFANDSQRLVSEGAPVEDKTSNLEIEPQKEEKKDALARDLSDFKAELSDLDAERLGALIKHRRSKHGQITGHSARLFRKAAAACGVSVADAVDICIDRNWITLKPDWLNKPNGRAPPSQAPSIADVFQFVGQRQGDEREPEDFGGNGALVPYLSVAGQRSQ
jgi:hypothetical protein